MPKLKRDEAGSFSKSERQKLKGYTQGGAAYGSVRNLVKASNLSVTKVRQFLHSKPSYTKFTLATRKFRSMKAFVRFKIEFWCMDLAYVDKLAKKTNGVKCLLVRQDLFHRTVDLKKTKTKDTKETAFLTLITKKNCPNNTWFYKGTEFDREFKKLCKHVEEQNYSTRSETKAAFAERKMRSLKNALYRYMEGNRCRVIHKVTQFVTTLNSRRNCSIDLIPKNVKNSDFLSFLYSKPLREFRKPKFNIGDRVSISKYNLPFRKDYKLQFTQEVFEIVAIFFQKTSNIHNKRWTRWDYPR